MKKARGYRIITDPLGTKEEDTFTCCHCNAITAVIPFKGTAALGAWCTCCDAPMCWRCAKKGGCEHIEKKLERWESRGRIASVLEEDKQFGRLARLRAEWVD